MLLRKRDDSLLGTQGKTLYVRHMTHPNLNIGLIGAGVFGGYHANKLAVLDKANFVGVFDPDSDRKNALAQKHNVKAYDVLDDLLNACDAVIIATHASSHGEIARHALNANCHTLIEKPVATDLDDAKAIVALSQKKSLCVQVGHQERFVIQAIGLDKVAETPTHIIATRNTSYSQRGTDTSVTLDLMSHDIDLCCYLMGGVPHTVSGTSEAMKSDTPDRARAELSFANGTAILSASRVEETVSRQMTLCYPSGTVLIDFANKTLQHNTPFALNSEFGEDKRAADSLGAATQSFVSSILDGTKPFISAQDGLNAARIAIEIDRV